MDVNGPVLATGHGLARQGVMLRGFGQWATAIWAAPKPQESHMARKANQSAAPKQSSASLAIREGDDGRALLHCHAQCDTADVLAQLGLEPRDLFPDQDTGPPRSSIATTYDYTDEHDNLLFQVVRKQPKGFYQRRPDGSGGWVNKLGDCRRVLYRLPELVAADADDWVFLVEGEKDTDRLRSLGLVATTVPGGAGKWRDEYTGSLQGRQVVVIPDNDEPGRTHADSVATALYGHARDIKVLPLPGVPEHSDVSDWLEDGHTRDELLALVESTRTSDPASVQSVQNVHTQAVPSVNKLNTLITWAEDLPEPEDLADRQIWGPFASRGALALWSGIAGVGKSTLAYGLAVHAARGEEFGGLQLPDQGVKVLLLDLETPEALRSAKLDAITEGSRPIGQIAFWNETARVSVNDLIRAIREGETSLVIIDTLSIAFPVDSEDDNAAATEQMRSIKRVAAETDAAVIAIHHLGKGEQTEGGVYSARGASARPAAADIVVSITHHKEEADVVTLRLDKSRFTTQQVLHLQQMGEDVYKLRTDLDGVCASKTSQCGRHIEQLLFESGTDGTQLRDIVAAIIGTEFSESTVRRGLSDLVTRGAVKRRSHGTYVHTKHARSVQSAHTPLPPPGEQNEQVEHMEAADDEAAREKIRL